MTDAKKDDPPPPEPEVLKDERGIKKMFEAIHDEAERLAKLLEEKKRKIGRKKQGP